MKTLRIFISSPGDVVDERDKAKLVIAALQREVGDEATLLPVLWEDLAIPATASFQEGIDFVLSERHLIDIAVFILWSRLGSPLGNAITKPDGSAYRSGTEREFDLMLAAFEQSGRKMPLILAYTRDDLGAFSEKLDARTQHDDALEELLRQRKLVKQFIKENFHDNEGRNLRAYHSYPEPVAFAQRLHVHLRQAVNDLLGLDHPAALWTDSPYRSLEVFDIQHAPIFCGRDEETCDVLQRLRDQQAAGCAFVCIVGASGSGKSSLARAGVAATLLQRSFDDGIQEWRTAVFIPGHAQGDLFNALARVLASALPELRDGIGGLEKLAQCFESQNHEAASILIATAIEAVADLKPETRNLKPRVLLLLDQLEELWTDRSITPEQREKFLQTIEFLASSGSISVLATLRSDFYPQAQLSPAFLRMKAERGHFDLTPPGPAALHQLIVQPARRAGLHFERHAQTSRSLDQQILEDATHDPAALPLLQYALAELYEKWAAQPPETRSSRVFTFADYEAMGGVEGALAKRASHTFDQLPVEVRAALDELLPLLISVDTVGEQNAVRRRAVLSELTGTSARRSLTEALVKARFLTTDDEAGQPIATLAHEALLRRWDRVRVWINANRDLLRMRTRVEQYHAMWEESGRNESRLLPPGLPLEEGRQLLDAVTQVLGAEIRRYVTESSAHYVRSIRAAVKRRRVVVGALTAFGLAAVITTAASLVTKSGERRAISKARELDVQLDAKRNETAAGRNSLCFDKAIWEHEHGSIRREVAWLTEALRMQPGDQSSLDRLTSILDSMDWAVPVTRLDLKQISGIGGVRPRETDLVMGEFSQDGTSVLAWTVDLSGNPVRTFRAPLGGGTWESTSSAPPSSLPPVKSGHIPQDDADVIRLLRDGGPLLREPEPWMPTPSSDPLEDKTYTRVLYSPGKRWAVTVHSVVNNIYGGIYFIEQLFDRRFQKAWMVGDLLDSEDKGGTLFPLFDPTRDRLWLLDAVAGDDENAQPTINIWDLKSEGELTPPALVKILDDEGDLTFYHFPSRRPVVENAMLSKDGSVLALFSSEALESRLMMKSWIVAADSLLCNRFAENACYLPGRPLDVSKDRRLLVREKDMLLVCDMRVPRARTVKAQSKSPEAKPLAFTDSLPINSKDGRLTLSSDGHGQYAVKDNKSGTTASFWLEDAPGESGEHYGQFVFSEDGEWVIAESPGPSVATCIFDSKSGRQVFPKLSFTMLNALSPDKTIGIFEEYESGEKLLRRLKAPVPVWYLEFIEAMAGCRIENGGPLDLEPVTVSKAWADLVPKMLNSADQPYAEHLRNLFGTGDVQDFDLRTSDK